MKKSMMAMAALAVVALMTGCMSHRMMMSDHSMMMSDGTMMMMNADGTSRAMTDDEMNSHMAMMMKDPRYSDMMMSKMKSDPSMSSMMMDKCKGMMGHSMPMSGDKMMMMNADGTSRAMTDAEMRAQMDMMMKSPQMSKMMMDKMMESCKGM